jgi:YD repeat-containing protein
VEGHYEWREQCPNLPNRPIEQCGQPPIWVEVWVVGPVEKRSHYTDYDELGRPRANRGNNGQNIAYAYDNNGNVKVVDFGIAKGISDTNLTDVGTGMGTVHYVSPEQAKGEPATPLSDVYSTGVVLFEMLTGTLPFSAPSVAGILMKQITEAAPDLRTVRPDAPEDLALAAGLARA